MGVLRNVFFIVTCLLLTLTLCILIAALTHADWWHLEIKENGLNGKEIKHSSSYVGLWKSCVEFGPDVKGNSTCTDYKDILKFKNRDLILGTRFYLAANQRDFDVVLLPLIITTILTFFAWFCSIILYWRRDEWNWKIIAATIIMLATIAGLFNIGACTFGEIKYQKDWYKTNNSKYKYKHGWCILLAWVSSILNLLSAVMTVAVVRFVEKD